MKWNRVFFGKRDRISGIFSECTDGAKMIFMYFHKFGGANGFFLKFYAHGPAGVTDWMDSEKECALKYEEMSNVRQ